MAGRRRRLQNAAAAASNNSRKLREAAAPKGSLPVATNAPYGFTVQGDLIIDDSKIQEVSDDLVVDSPGKIKLDSHTGIYWFVKNTTLQGYIQADGADNMLVHNEVANGDIKFSGNDAGSGVTALTLDMSEAGAGALTLPRMTTTQRNALTAAVGMIIYNTTDSKFQGYDGSSWVNLH